MNFLNLILKIISSLFGGNSKQATKKPTPTTQLQPTEPVVTEPKPQPVAEPKYPTVDPIDITDAIMSNTLYLGVFATKESTLMMYIP